MLESTIVQKILKTLRARGCWAANIHGSEVAAGRPDILACCRGRFVALEVKIPGGDEPTKRQQYELDAIANAGGISACVHSVQETIDVLNKADL